MELLIFLILTLFFLFVSRRVITDFRSHGFYRFFAWECISLLIAATYRVWFRDPNSPRQIVSWILLTISLILVVTGLILLNRRGNPDMSRSDRELYDLEKTTKLIDTGIFRYIRHPMYSSLLFLTWGLLLKNPVWPLIILATASSVFIIIASLIEEKECIDYFGDEYRDYMKRTRRFVPFVV